MHDKPPLTTVVDARVEVAFTHHTEKTSRYRVLYDGQTLIESTDDPEYDACRALLAKGIAGTFVTYSLGSSTPRARVNVERGAKLMILENERHGPRLVPYKPRPDFPVERFAAQPVLTSRATQMTPDAIGRPCAEGIAPPPNPGPSDTASLTNRASE